MATRLGRHSVKRPWVSSHVPPSPKLHALSTEQLLFSTSFPGSWIRVLKFVVIECGQLFSTQVSSSLAPVLHLLPYFLAATPELEIGTDQRSRTMLDTLIRFLFQVWELFCNILLEPIRCVDHVVLFPSLYTSRICVVIEVVFFKACKDVVVMTWVVIV